MTNQTVRPRRLPRPAGVRGRITEAPAPDPVETDNPYVTEIVQQIERVSSISHLSPYVILNDWLGMMEPALQRYNLNMKSLAITGRFTEDPPEVAEIFRRARERYVEASKKYPATYREMQIAFSTSFAVITRAAAHGLEAYARQFHYSPDIIGQVFLKCVNPGPAWWRYFPPWPTALALARLAIPDGQEKVYQALEEAHLTYSQAVARPIRPEPGEQFQRWFEAVVEYFEPILVGPTVIGSSAAMLAAAAQFPDWAVKRGLIQFYAPPDEPLLERMININAILYGLNGHAVDIINTANDIATYYQGYSESDSRAWPVVFDESDLPYLALGDVATPRQPPEGGWGEELNLIEGHNRPGATQLANPGMPSFEALFKQKR